MQVVAVGTAEFTLGFELVGIKTHNFQKAEEIKTLAKEPTGVIIIDKKTMDGFDEFDRKEFEDSIRPLFVVLSTKDTSENISKLIRKSIGIEI